MAAARALIPLKTLLFLEPLVSEFQRPAVHYHSAHDLF
jgi:hypothetical protein